MKSRLFAVLLMFACNLSAEAQQREAALPQPDSMPLVAPLFLENSEYSSALTMVNELNGPITAQVIVHDSQGAEITRKAIEFSAHSQRRVEIKDLLSAAGSAAVWGSISVLPDC